MENGEWRIYPIKQPKVALMVEPPFSTYTCGQLYFLFDQVTELPVERIRTSILKQIAIPKFGQRYGSADLKDYDVLILPGGGQHLQKLFGKTGTTALKTWVNNDGVLVASGYSAQDNLDRLAGNVFAGVQPIGKGKVVFLLDNTQYRMFWRGPSRMMQNAVMLLKGM